MAPASAEVKKALVQAVRDIWASDTRDSLTVNTVRRHVEEELGLDEGFLAGAEWKAKSKELIHKEVAQCELEEPSSSPAKPSSSAKVAKPKKATRKRPSAETKVPAKKRRKKSPSPDDESEPEESDEESEDSFEEEAAPKKPLKKAKTTAKAKPAKKRRKKSPSPDDESESEEPDEEGEDSFEEEAAPKKPLKKAKTTTKAKPAKAASKSASAKRAKKIKDVSEDECGNEVQDEGSGPGDASKAARLADRAGTDDDDVKDGEPAKGAKQKEADVVKNETEESSRENGISRLESAPGPEVKKNKDKADSEDSPLSNAPDSDLEDQKSQHKKKVSVHDDDSSELSEVLDESPKPKRKSKGAEPKVKPTGNTKDPVKKAATAETDPEAAEIKKLQSQLAKCGMRKIWQFELKKYGDDNKAKVRHLKNVLKEIGMGGRFSEAKAKEIKEQRELLADLEAVQEMDQNWGVGERSSRNRRLQTKRAPKAYEEDSGEDGEDGEGSDAEGPSNSRARVSARARAGLAFLDDDDEDASD